MLGWIDWKPQGLPLIRKRVELLCGMPLCRVEISGKAMPLLRPFLRREERILRQAGVREGAWRDNLPECLHLGLVPVETAPLRRAVLPALLEQAFRQKRLSDKNGSVRLTADGTSLPVYWAAQLLVQRVRYLHLDTGYGQGALEQWLLQRYGLACGGMGTHRPCCWEKTACARRSTTYCRLPCAARFPAAARGSGCWRLCIGRIGCT